MIVWDLIERTQKMKGKRHTTEERIRILRKADGGKSILDVCREHNISEQTFHRWKREFGMMEVNQAKRLKVEFPRKSGDAERSVRVWLV